MTELLEPLLGRYPETINITNSEIQTFKDCRRKWYLSYYLGLTPKKEKLDGPLPLGTRVHDSLELYYTDGIDPVITYNTLATDDRIRFQATEEFLDESTLKKYDSDLELGRIMVEGYKEWIEEDSRDADFEFVEAEKAVSYPVDFDGVTVNLMGKIDLKLRNKIDDSILITDHKALHVDQRVLTPEGWKRIGDIKVNDLVYSPSGEEVRVKGVYPQGEVKLNKITLTDKTELIACDDHLWSVHKQNSSHAQVVSTREMKEFGVTRNSNSNKVWKITNITGQKKLFSTRNNNLPADPYSIGLWIGDGNKDGRISVHESEIHDLVKGNLYSEYTSRYFPETNMLSIYGDYRDDVGVRKNKWKDTLMSLGLWGLGSHERFIPRIYIETSYENRLKILRGIMDADGCVRGKNKQIVLNTTSRRLASDLVELSQSLGGRATVGSRPARSYYYGENQEKRVRREVFYVSFQFNADTCPFTLPRKIELFKSKPRVAWDRYIGSIEDSGVGEAVCIEVDSDDKLYITEGHTRTHNTTAASAWSNYDKYTHMSEQLMFYITLSRAIGENVDGAMYNLLKKVKRTGTAKPPFYDRKIVRFNPTQLDSFWDRTMSTIADIVDTRKRLDDGESHLTAAYPRPSNECAWKCPFFEMCTMMDDGSSYERYLDDFYVKVDPNARYGAQQPED